MFSFLIFANWFGVHLGGWFAHTALFCLLGNRQKKDEQTKNDSWEETRDRNDTFARCYVYPFLQFFFFFSEIYMMFGTLFPKKSEKLAEGIFVSFSFIFLYLFALYLYIFYIHICSLLALYLSNCGVCDCVCGVSWEGGSRSDTLTRG